MPGIFGTVTVRNPTHLAAWLAALALKGKSRVERGAQLFRAGAEANFDAALVIFHRLPDGQMKREAAHEIRIGAPEPRKAEAISLGAEIQR